MRTSFFATPGGLRLHVLIMVIALLVIAPGQAFADGLAPLTDQPGNPAEGERLVRDTSRASCLICHTISTLDEKDQGEIGPNLDGVADRWTEAELRLRIVDARQLNPDTMMPPYFSLVGLYKVAEAYQGQTIYSAQEVEDVVAFLMTLITDEAVE